MALKVSRPSSASRRWSQVQSVVTSQRRTLDLPELQQTPPSLPLGQSEAVVPKYPQGAVAHAGALLTRASIERLRRERDTLAEEVDDWKKLHTKDKVEIIRLKEELAKAQAELARMNRDKTEMMRIQEEIKRFDNLREEATRKELPRAASTQDDFIDPATLEDFSDAEDQSTHEEQVCIKCQSMASQLSEAREARHIKERENRRLEIQVEELFSELKALKEKEPSGSMKTADQLTIRRLKEEMAQHKKHFEETMSNMRAQLCDMMTDRD